MIKVLKFQFNRIIIQKILKLFSEFHIKRTVILILVYNIENWIRTIKIDFT